MTRTVGVEEEFLVLRTDGPGLAERGDQVVRAAQSRDGDGQYEQELKQAQVELGSSPATALTDLRADLGALRGELAAAAAGRGARLVASGTSPRLEGAHVTAAERYRDMTDEYGLVARQQLTCGMHIHVGVDSPDEGIRVLDGLAPWLPLFTALSANSPFYAGQDTGLASYRAMLWGMWPTAGPTGSFGNLATYRSLVADVVRLGGARDEGMLYFDARLSSNYPTVELRVCDVTPDVDDAVAIAGLARALVEHLAAAGPGPSVRTELLRTARWRAARYGMTDQLVDLSGTTPSLRPAWELVHVLLDAVAGSPHRPDDLDEVRAGLDRMQRRGTGAARQRAEYDRRQDLDDVVDACTVARDAS